MKSRQCDVCKFNTADLGSDDDHGCKDCGCYDNGTTRCEDGLKCVCQENVVGEKCSSCKQNHYWVKSGKGCEPCACNSDGSASETCNLENGTCNCIKEEITGTRKRIFLQVIMSLSETFKHEHCFTRIKLCCSFAIFSHKRG